MIYLIWTILFIGVCTFTDLKEKKIYLLWCIINAVVGAVINLIMKQHSMIDLGAGAVIGIVFILVALCTKGKIGIGDGVVMMTIGLITGGVISFTIIVWSFIACTIISMVGFIVSKIKWSTSVPFMPYMLIGSIITFFIQEV